MTRTLRGAWSRRGTLLPLLLLTVVVVAGAVTVLGFADRAGTSPRLVVPLLLLGAVAVPSTGRELAAARRGEIALARLRGLQGAELYALLAVEPLLVLLAGGVGGLVVGGAGAWLAGHLWVGAEASLPGVSALLAGLGIVAVGLVAVLVGMAGALREPLSEQVGIASRPRASSIAAVFGEVLVLAAAVVAVYRSGVASTTEPDWVVLAGPALVGLAVGQVVVWLVRLVARVAVPRTGGSSLSGFLVVRRLARVADAAGPLRVLVAAAVVAALALTGATQVDGWTDETARLSAGGPMRVSVDTDAAGVLALTRDLDPDGRWLMAAVLVPGEGSVVARRAFLDTSRYAAVVGDFFGGTAADGVSRRIAELAGQESTSPTGDRLTATVEGVSARRNGRMRPLVRIAYRSGATAGVARIRLEVPTSGASTTASVRVPGCGTGCVLTGLTLARSKGDTTLPWILTGLDLGGVDKLAPGWQPAFEPRNFRGTQLPGGPVPVDNGLLAVATRRPLSATPVAAGKALPVLATDSATWEGPPQVGSTGGEERPAQVLDRLPALPLVEADGLLADLPRAAAGAPPTVPAAQVMVLARADTPDIVLGALVEAAGHPPQTLDQAVTATADRSGAAQAKVYSLMALFCLVSALLVLAAAVARQRGSWRREVAALRLVGVPVALLRRSGRVEVLWLSVAAVGATVVGSLAAVRLLLAHLALVRVPLHAVPLLTGVAVGPVLVAAGVVVLAVVVVTGRGRAVHGGETRPAILREEGSA